MSIRLHSVVTWLALAGTLGAQSTAPPGDLCFHPRPRDRCGWFLVTEAGFIRRLTPVYPYREMMGTGALGLMRNVGARTAIGGALVVHTNFDDRIRIGPTVRLRRWVGSWVGLDAAAGPVVSTRGASGGASSLGFTTHAGVNFAGLLSVRTQLDNVPAADRYGGLSDPFHWSVALAAESYPGAAGIVAGLLAVAARAWADSWSGF